MKKYIIITLLLFVILLSACTGQSTANPQSVATVTSESTGVEQGAAALPESSPTTATVEVQATFSMEVQAEEFVVKQGLEASDLDGVTIASGDVQLIEFFAFW